MLKSRTPHSFHHSVMLLLFWLLYYRLRDGPSPHSIKYAKHLNPSDLIFYDQILKRKRSRSFHSSLWCPTDDVTTRLNIPTWRCWSPRPCTSVIPYCSNGKKSPYWAAAVREEMQWLSSDAPLTAVHAACSTRKCFSVVEQDNICKCLGQGWRTFSKGACPNCLQISNKFFRVPIEILKSIVRLITVNYFVIIIIIITNAD